MSESKVVIARLSWIFALLTAGGLTACGEPGAGYGWIAKRDGHSYCLIPVMHLERFAPVEPRSEVARCIDEASEVLVETDPQKVNFQHDYNKAVASYLRTLKSRPVSSQVERDRARAALATRFTDRQIPPIDSTATDGEVVEFLMGTYQIWAGFEWGKSSEHQLTNRARALGKPFSELETVQSQWRAVETSLQLQSTTFLHEAIRKVEARELDLVLDAASTAWRDRNPSRLVLAQRGMLSRYASERVGFEHTLRARDKAFADALASRRSMPGKKPAVVLVGALHFVGDDSLLDQLRARGFTIAPLP